MRELSIDIETFSSEALKQCGIYKYIESPDFEVILFAWAFDDEPIQIVDSLSKVPTHVRLALMDKTVLKTAWNAAFEIACLEVGFNMELDATQWSCSMLNAMAIGLPGSLDAAGLALKLDTIKDPAGKALIKYFCMPCKPTKVNGMRVRNFPWDDAEKWEAFKQYCIRDVEQERKIKRTFSYFEFSETEKLVWQLDHKINKQGVKINEQLALNAIAISALHKEECTREAIELTGLDNPNSVKQLKGWFEAAIDAPIESLTKKDLPLLKEKTDDVNTLRVMEIRQELSKTSVKKYQAMINGLCDDGRLKGLLQYYGGARTGRWAGRLVQVQNLPRNTMDLLDTAREMVLCNDYEGLSMLWSSVPDVLSQLIRTAFIADEGNTLISSDFSAIEARVIAWLANEPWRLEVFRTHGKIYEASASTMFKVPLESIGKGSDLRQRGKVAELALGFGGGPDALKRMGALEMEFMKKLAKEAGEAYDNMLHKPAIQVIDIITRKKTERVQTRLEYVDEIQTKELAKLVKIWRNANPKIVKYWSEVNDAAIYAVQNPGAKSYIDIENHNGVYFELKHNILWLALPSGRKLAYQQPKLVPGKFEGTWSLTYLGVDQNTKRWERIPTYGGKLVENIVQAVARDLLAEAMLRLNKAGFKIVMHVHDEVVMEVNKQFAASSVMLINSIMTMQPSWAKANSLPLGAESTISDYYKKD